MSSGLDRIQGIESLNLKEKRVFLRLDLNVPIEGGIILDDFRIRAALPSIQYLLEKEAKVVLASHLGRPKGQKNPKFSLEPVAERLRDLLEIEILFVEDPDSVAPKSLLSGLKKNQIILLENLRSVEGEEKNSHELAGQLASYVDVYINDAFGASHRAHASIVGLPSLAKEKAIGYLMQKEVEMLDQVLYKAESPFHAVLGGSKVSDKIGLIENLMEKIDCFYIGGAMAYTFLEARGFTLGNSKIEKAKVALAGELLERIESRDKEILLPIDHIIVEELKAGAEYKITDSEVIPDGWMAVDIGPKTRKLYTEKLTAAKTIFWNGPMGVYEIAPFDQGSLSIAEALSQSNATTIVGGGDSAAVTKQSGLEEKMTHISTGGGASLEYLQGSALPGLEVLRS